MTGVEICDDMSCVIFNETAYTTATEILKITGLTKKEKKSIYLKHQSIRCDPSDNWLVVSLEKERQKGCNKF